MSTCLLRRGRRTCPTPPGRPGGRRAGALDTRNCSELSRARLGRRRSPRTTNMSDAAPTKSPRAEVRAAESALRPKARAPTNGSAGSAICGAYGAGFRSWSNRGPTSGRSAAPSTDARAEPAVVSVGRMTGVGQEGALGATKLHLATSRLRNRATPPITRSDLTRAGFRPSRGGLIARILARIWLICAIRFGRSSRSASNSSSSTALWRNAAVTNAKAYPSIELDSGRPSAKAVLKRANLRNSSTVNDRQSRP